MRYTGIRCPICGIPLQADSDIVTCPDCGASYRWYCCEKEGKCLFSDTYNTGTYWTPPAEDSTAPEKNSEIVHPVYSRNNPSGALFCSRYDSSLNRSDTASPSHQGQVPFRNDPPGYRNPYQSSGYQGPGSPTPLNAPFDPVQGDSPYQSASDPFSPITIRADEPVEDDITAGEIAKFVQNNPSYFLSAFFHRRRTNRGHFSFSAFLFSGGWMLYRKTYRIGTITTAQTAALSATSTFVSLNYSSSLPMKLYEQAGANTSIYPSYEESTKVIGPVYLLDLGSIILLFTPLLALLIQAGIAMCCGPAGNRLYYRHCVEGIRELETEYPITARYDEALQENGGANVSLALCLLICCSIVIYFPNFFI